MRGGGGAGGAAGSGSLGVSRTDSASWIADRAASVGSFIFFGVFAISVVASYYAGPLSWTITLDHYAHGSGRTCARPRHERVSLNSPSDPPRAAGSNAPRRHSTAVRLSYRLGIPMETAC